jgi:hypothetical protein
MRAVLVMAGAALVLAACGPTPTREAYHEQIRTWVGKHADVLARTWGPPDKSWKFADGATLMQYDRAQRRIVPGLSYPDNDYVYVRGSDGRLYRQAVTRWRREPDRLVLDTCTTKFTIGPDSLIKAFEFSGNDCVALPAPVTGQG